MLWALFTIVAALAQTFRNAFQRDLTQRFGVVGATHVRFLYGFPFSLLFLGVMQLITGEVIPALPGAVFPLVLIAASTQVAATALMLAAMRSRSFVVTIAYTKLEPVLVALFGAIILSETLSGAHYLAIGIATLGVMLTAWPKEGGAGWSLPSLGLGIGSAAMFAVSALWFRQAIQTLPSGGFGIRASTILVIGLGMQALLLSVYLLVSDRKALLGLIKGWRASIGAGFLGAAASQCWFIGFALAPAAAVRTLGLVEVLFARIVSGRMFSEAPSPREGLGLACIVAGVAALLLL